MLRLVELPGYERRKPTQISGGQAQRVALARALINRPAVLLLDEPLGALDLKLRKQMQVELKRIQQEVGITFIYVTHDQEEAMTMSESDRRHEPRPVRAARRPREPLRAPDDPLRRRLPRREQPAAGDDRRPGRRLRPRASSATTRGSGSRAASSTVTTRSRWASGPRRSGCTRRPRTSRRAHNELPGHRRRRLVPRGVDVLRGPVADGGAAGRLRAERGTDRPRLTASTGGSGPTVMVAGSHVRGERRPQPRRRGAGLTGPLRPREVPTRR